MQVALRRRAQIELGLLDQDHVAADARLGEGGDRAHERQAAVLGLPLLARPTTARFAGGRSARGVRSARRCAGKKSAGGAPSRFRFSVPGGFASRNSVRPPTYLPRRGSVCIRATRRRPSASAPPPRAASRPPRGRSTCRTTIRRRARTPRPARADQSRHGSLTACPPALARPDQPSPLTYHDRPESPLTRTPSHQRLPRCPPSSPSIHGQGRRRWNQSCR